MPQLSADTIAEGDIHWIAAGAVLPIWQRESHR
jgi:hypothetical protein